MPAISTKPGTLSQEAMLKKLSTFPQYQASPAAPAIQHAETVLKLWGGRLTPLMAESAARGRFSSATLSCPPRACTGVIEMPVRGHSRAYRNPGAIENILCLEGTLEVRYGPQLEQKITLERFDMVSIPENIRHSLHNTSQNTLRAVMVLNTSLEGDYCAVFEATDSDAQISRSIAQALDVQFDNQSGAQLQGLDLSSRTTRFKSLVPYKKDLSTTAGIPPEATEMLSASSVFPLIVPTGHVGRSRTAPMYGLPGLYISIAQCTAGDDGPPPHAHSDTQESFFVLDGEWEFSTGFDNEVSVEATAYDLIAMPTKVMRTFRNRGDKPAHLFVIIQGPDKMNDTVSFSRRIGTEVERRFGKETIEAYAKIKMVFDAEDNLQSKV